MQEKKKKQSKSSLLILGIIFSPILIFLVLIILGFIVLISPMAVLGFIFYYLFQLINNCHRRNKNFQFDIQNLAHE